MDTRALSRAGFVTNHGPAGSNTKRISPFPKRSSLITTSQQLPQLPDATMFLQRSAVAVARRAAMAPALRRSLATSAVRRESARPENRQLPRKISQAGTQLRSLSFQLPARPRLPVAPIDACTAC